MASSSSLLSRFWQSRWVRWLTYLGAFFVALIAALTVWMNRKGERDWKAAQEALVREGVELDFKAVKVVPIPDAENFCAIPLLNGISVVEDGDASKGEPAAKRKALEALGLPPVHATISRPSISSSASIDVPLELREWADWFRKIGHPMPVTDPDNVAREVLGALSYQDAAMVEMAAALDRPVSRLVPDWRLGPLPDPLLLRQMPHLSALQNLATGLGLRAKAAAQAGECSKAHEASLCLARIAEASCQEPHVIGLLVGITFTSILADATWELGTAHCGTAEDFLRLQRALEKFDIRRDAVRAFKEEVAANVDSIFYVQRHRKFPDFPLGVGGSEWDTAEKLLWLIPEGWFESNAAHVAMLNLDHIVRPLRDHGWATALAEGDRLEARLKAAKAEIWWHPDMIVAVLSLPAFSRFVDRATYTQCQLDRAIIACALERFRLEHGTYPNALAELARAGEKPLPLDILSGNPMGYRKTDDGRYVLWAVGFDRSDDGGYRPKGDGRTDKPTRRNYRGDWVWTYPTPEEIAEAKDPAPPTGTKRVKTRTLKNKAENPPQKSDTEPTQ
ncbi:MAG: type IV pilin protein [Roseimicrobium sp.]